MCDPNSMAGESKRKRYGQLVADRKACACCPTLTHQSRVLDGSLDSDRIGPYTRWQGNLDAPLMVVGQDFANVERFIELQGWPGADVQTNRRLVILVNTALEAAGCHCRIRLPEYGRADDRLFFTNAVLCLKSGNMSAPIPTVCFKNCTSFLQRTIDIVQPSAVIGLGFKAWQAILRAFPPQSQPEPFGGAVGSEPIPIGCTRLFAAYHPANRRRSMIRQVEDWTAIGKVLRKQSWWPGS